jgi:hypothetical protein
MVAAPLSQSSCLSRNSCIAEEKTFKWARCRHAKLEDALRDAAGRAPPPRSNEKQRQHRSGNPMHSNAERHALVWHARRHGGVAAYKVVRKQLC